jgi:hypothetical protein
MAGNISPPQAMGISYFRGWEDNQAAGFFGCHRKQTFLDGLSARSLPGFDPAIHEALKFRV